MKAAACGEPMTNDEWVHQGWAFVADGEAEVIFSFVICHSPRHSSSRSAMDILFLLIPLSVVLALAILGALAWAVWRGQFESLDAEGERILKGD